MRNTKVEPSEWLDVPQAAAYLNLPDQSLRRLIRDGVLPYSKPGGKPKSRIRISRRDLDALMEFGYHDATAGPLAP